MDCERGEGRGRSQQGTRPEEGCEERERAIHLKIKPKRSEGDEDLVREIVCMFVRWFFGSVNRNAIVPIANSSFSFVVIFLLIPSFESTYAYDAFETEWIVVI